jgi:hypothetical protein
MAAPNLLKPFSDFLIISTAARLPSPIPPDWRHLEPRAVVPPAALLLFAPGTPDWSNCYFSLKWRFADVTQASSFCSRFAPERQLGLDGAKYAELRS